MNARDTILRRIRAATADAPPAEAVSRGYRTAGGAVRHEPGEDDLIALFAHRVDDYHASVRRVPAGEAAQAVGAAARERGLTTLAVPPGLPEEWTSGLTAVRLLRDDPPLAPGELDRAGGVITGCAVAIAETGTIVLDAGPGQGRRALTLLPDYHLCVVPADRVVRGVPEAVALLDPRRPQTWISGPSATSDIELDRVEGVHGPRVLDVIILGN
ncbi:L-lactate dehydrogenase complex protein LldG [Sinosporangium album]|uniref:L-lactate dehydrogenase complex protein LldG n=1 Tax=Sinosporangium album TaxID=504805 RepID=A0A1G7T5F1_9ACTN|nr:LUD domain-containing protein [Sinosporangium album]SDG30597.1 L-lactate dehydrogenase complex protein LldG [Sinosporangium album]